jgi:hypothetical protein
MFAPPIEELRTTLEALVGEDLAEVGNLRLDREIAEVGRLVAVLEAESLRRAGEWERRRLWMLDGSRSARVCLARRWGAPVGSAGQRLLMAARLREASTTRAVFASGDLS